jgi:hypothetical protein
MVREIGTARAGDGSQLTQLLWRQELERKKDPTGSFFLYQLDLMKEKVS